MSDEDILRLPPNSEPAEQALLGSLLSFPDTWIVIADKITAGDFYRGNHRDIFSAMTALAGKNTRIDLVSVTEELRRIGNLDADGGVAYLRSLHRNASSPANVSHYAKLIRDLASRRQLIALCTDLADSAYATQHTTAELADRAHHGISDIVAGKDEKGFAMLDDVLHSTYERIEARLGGGTDHLGVGTGIGALDEILGGTGPGEVLVIGARPSVGKTALAMQVGIEAAIRDLTVAAFSLEMPGWAIAERLLAYASRLDAKQLRDGTLDETEWSQFTRGAKRISNRRFAIDDSSGITIVDARTRLHRLRQRVGKLDLVIFDYVQLARASGENRATQVSNISRGLKAIAKDFAVPVIALAQLNRQAAGRRPEISDLRESGDIEADADQIVLLHRPSEDDDGLIEAIVGKNRNGGRGVVSLAFIGAQYRFAELSPDYWETAGARPEPARNGGRKFAYGKR